MADQNPCKIVEHPNGTFSLLFLDFQPTATQIEDAGREPNGYTWAAITEALVRTSAPQLEEDLEYDPEADMLSVVSKNRAALEAVAALITQAISDPSVLHNALLIADQD